MSTKPMARFYTVAQVADLLAVSTRSVRRWIARGELLAHKFGRQVRISEIDLRAFVQWGRYCHVNRKFAGQMTMAATVHAATVAWRHVSIA